VAGFIQIGLVVLTLLVFNRRVGRDGEAKRCLLSVAVDGNLHHKHNEAILCFVHSLFFSKRLNCELYTHMMCHFYSNPQRDMSFLHLASPLLLKNDSGTYLNSNAPK